MTIFSLIAAYRAQQQAILFHNTDGVYTMTLSTVNLMYIFHLNSRKIAHIIQQVWVTNLAGQGSMKQSQFRPQSRHISFTLLMGAVACTSFLLGTQFHWHRSIGSTTPLSTHEKRNADRANEAIFNEINTNNISVSSDLFSKMEKINCSHGGLGHAKDILIDLINDTSWFKWANFRKPLLYSQVPQDFDPTSPGSVNITYESCVQSLRGTSTTKTLKRRIHWLHFPKCGTSFGAVLYGYLCQYNKSAFVAPNSAQTPGANCTYCGRRGKNSNKPTIWDPHLRKLIPFDDERGHIGMKFCDWSVPVPHFPFTNHFAHAWNWEQKQYKDAPVALFRDPRRRAVSAWNNNKHSYGIGTFNNPFDKKEARQRINALQTVFEFARYPAIQSCQTKMLLGEYCGEYLNITTQMFHEAIRRVLNMEFVGLTDAFNASVCLWHHQFGGTPHEWMFQSVGKVRSGEYMFAQSQKAKTNRERDPEPLPGGGDRAHPNTWCEYHAHDLLRQPCHFVAPKCMWDV